MAIRIPMTFVLDASMTMAWVFPDEATAATDRLLESLVERQAHAPGLWPIEVANAFLAATRRRRLEAGEWPWIRHCLEALPIAVDSATPARVWSSVLELAHDRGISVYDAMYLELAVRMRLPLATLDGRLPPKRGPLAWRLWALDLRTTGECRARRRRGGRCLPLTVEFCRNVQNTRHGRPHAGSSPHGARR